MKLAATLVFGFASALAGCASSANGAPTLCRLAEARESYAGQTLTVEGFLLVSRHGSAVTDPTCGYGIGISWNDGVREMRDLEAIAERASAWPGMMVRVRVTGELKRGRALGWIEERGWVLELSAAHVLSARPLAEEDAERYLTWLDGPSPEAFRPSH